MTTENENRLVTPSNALDGATISYDYQTVDWSFYIEFNDGKLNWRGTSGEVEGWVSAPYPYNARKIREGLWMIHWLELPDANAFTAEEITKMEAEGLTPMVNRADKVTLVIDLVSQKIYSSVLLEFIENEEHPMSVHFDVANIDKITGVQRFA